MKLLIAYDGSRSADDAIADLASAGLPRDAEATIIAVAEKWLPHLYLADDHPELEAAARDRRTEAEDQGHITKGLDEASALASHAGETLLKLFPDWIVDVKTVNGSPALEILTEAERAAPDLIVMGSQGRTAVGRLLLGSISQKVLAEAKCSVRIGRVTPNGKDEKMIVIGFDGSPGSNAAVDAVAARRWRGGCKIFLVTASDALVPTAIGRFIPPIVRWVEEEVRTERELIRKLAESAFHKLGNAGCEVDLRVRNGNPKQVIVEEAERLGADCIFLGANSYGSKLERFLIGSTSTAVAARSHCTVEVVRPRP